MNRASDHTSVIFIGDIPANKALFLKLENALLMAQENEILEIVSTNPAIERELLLWCTYKGVALLDKTHASQQTCYKIQNTKTPSYNAKAISGFTMPGIEQGTPKMSDWSYHESDTILTKAPSNHGLSSRESLIENGSIAYGFEIDYKEKIWAKPVAKLYEEASNNQWNATTDIAWKNLPKFDPKFEQAICQIMTYLVENEFSALYIPGQFISQVNPYYSEIPLFLSSLMNDEARHIEVFTKRANANGGGMQYSSAVTQRSLYSLFMEKDYIKSSFLLHVMGEGTFIDLLTFLEEHMPDETTKEILRYVRKDESRHVAYGMAHMKSVLEQNPKKINALKDTVFKRKEFMDELSGESTLLLEAMAMLAGGGTSIGDYVRGYDSVVELQKKMNVNRIKRLVDIGIDEDLAHDLSRIHTVNFM